MSSGHAPLKPGKRAASSASTGAHNPSEQPTSAEPDSTPLQRFCAELLGTFLLVLFHGGAAASLKVIQRGPDTTVPGLVFVALADGFSLFIIIMIIGKVSGVLINPAVTLALAVRGRFAWRDVPYYLVAQFAGASLGAAVILAAMGRDALAIGRLGAVQLAPGVGIWQGILVEALGAFFLVLTISATAEDPRSPSGWAAFTIGMALAAIVLVFAPVTGAPVNPARAFGPNLGDALLGLPVNWGVYAGCYLLGPLVGATGASILYRYLANQPPSKPAAEPD